MGKKWEHVTFDDIRIGDVIRRTDAMDDGTVKTLVGAIHLKGLLTASTVYGFVLAQASDRSGGVVQRRVRKVKKPKLPVEPGTVIDAVVVRSWEADGSCVSRREIRLIKGWAHWVGVERNTGWQFITPSEDIVSWTLVAAPWS